MSNNERIILYHGTAINSALDILNRGLDKGILLEKSEEPTQLGIGFYSAFDLEVAHFFGSRRADGGQYTIIKFSTSPASFSYLLSIGWAKISPIVNVSFVADQVWFSLDSFDWLNQNVVFEPHK